MRYLLISFAIISCMQDLPGQSNIMECLHVKDSIFQAYEIGALQAEKEIVDIENNYYALEYIERDTEGHIYHRFPLFQAVAYKNIDHSSTLFTTEYHVDEQCHWHKSHFYKISQNRDSIREIPLDQVMPELKWEYFLSNAQPKAILETYLPAIKQEYLDSTATIEDIYGEIYDHHYFIQRDSSKLEIELTTCDYIPRNVVGFYPEEWEAIENNTQTIVLGYNRSSGQFEFTALPED